jgi:hypothetical protein
MLEPGGRTEALVGAGTGGGAGRDDCASAGFAANTATANIAARVASLLMAAPAR